MSIRLVRFDGGRTGLVAGDRVVDLSDIDDALHPGASWQRLIEGWGEWGGRLAAIVEDHDRAATLDLASVRLEPPLPEPAARIFAMGGNFPAHLSDMASKIDLPDSVTKGGDDTPPWGFYVIPGTTVAAGAEIRPPKHVKTLDYEAEVGVVLTGEPVADDGTVAIWGYTAWNDFSIRDAALKLSKVDHGPLTWSLQKNFDTANSCGPWMVVDEGRTVADLGIRLRVNGETRQDGRTSGMRFGFGAIAAHLEEYLTLRAGDMILSGTPAGTAMEGGKDGRFLQDGDEVEVEVDGVAILRNRIRLG